MVFLWIVLGFLFAGLIIALCGGFLLVVVKVVIGLITLIVSLATSLFFPSSINTGINNRCKKGVEVRASTPFQYRQSGGIFLCSFHPFCLFFRLYKIFV